ncbi:MULTISPECIES: substrate-binding domain-containing protein [unclassified Streptomyces]|uniref:substrate-binding domain-containing protein n=1 Tax=unclassified Streptomyces TaxID=2593676 RepID=UPI0038158AE0
MDDWLSADNIVAVLTAIVGLVVSVGVVWYERRVPRRKRIGYRVQMDTPIGSDDPDGETGTTNVRLGLFNDLPDMVDATLVLLRIENDGGESIADSDYTNRDPHRALNVVFAGRLVRGVAVTQADTGSLMDHFAPVGGEGGVRHEGNVIHLPRVPLNRGQHYKLLVLLTGGHVGGGVRITGGIRDGVVVPNKAMPVDAAPPLFSRATRWITILLTVCVTVLATIIVVREDAPPPLDCATGRLTVTGSTAFAPVMKEIARHYAADCAGSEIRVEADSSDRGVRDLAKAGEAGHGSAVVAMSDGPRPESGPSKLQENRIAVSAFALVVNDAIPVRDLTIDQIRGIFRGSVVNWKDVGGPDRAISLVSRNSESGTRDIFRRRVLGGASEPGFTSRDCVTKNFGADPVIRCELDSTEDVLAEVGQVPGAIGYAELGAAKASPHVHILAINGRAPSTGADGDTRYPFNEIEYAYTYGTPDADSLTASFLHYLRLGPGQAIVASHGHLPCDTPAGFLRCAR